MTRLRPLIRWTCCLLMSASAASAVEIIAHRGASHAAPENTLRAARLAWDEKADATECDLHLTKDGQVVVVHDASTRRTAGRDAQVAELTLAEVRELDAGVWKGPGFSGEKIPTLDEILGVVPAGKKIYIEIKTGPEIVPALKAGLERSRLDRRQAVIITFNEAAALAAKRTLPHYSVYLLSSYKVSAETGRPQPTLDQLLEICAKGKLDGLDLDHRWPLTSEDVRRIRRAGLGLCVWTVDDPTVARRWLALGVDGITTNRPAWLREQLQD